MTANRSTVENAVTQNDLVRRSHCCQSCQISAGKKRRNVSFDSTATAKQRPLAAAAHRLRRGERARAKAASSQATEMLSRNTMRWKLTASGDSPNSTVAAVA